MKSNIETIDGVKGEWRTVTKPEEVTVGQWWRGLYSEPNKVPHNVGHSNDFLVGMRVRVVESPASIFSNPWYSNIQAFFPLPVKPERTCKSESKCQNTSCRDYDATMVQNCARPVSKENDEPFATVCERKCQPAKRKVAKRPSKYEKLLKAIADDQDVLETLEFRLNEKQYKLLVANQNRLTKKEVKGEK
jgi:hypothetical protein